MAFTEAQKVKLRQYLGYPDVYRDANPRLESAFSVIGERPDTQAAVEVILTSLAAVELSITAALSTAGLKRAEDIEWYQAGAAGSQIEGRRSEGRAHCSRLSIMFGVPILCDAFGRSGYQGDGYMGKPFQGGFPGGMM